MVISLSGITSKTFRNYNVTFEVSDCKDTAVNKQGYGSMREKNTRFPFTFSYTKWLCLLNS